MKRKFMFLLGLLVVPMPCLQLFVGAHMAIGWGIACGLVYTLYAPRLVVWVLYASEGKRSVRPVYNK